MHLNCPHCQNPIELVTLTASGEVLCAACGSTFRVETEPTVTWCGTSRGGNLGRFELRSVVGAGAFGAVYKAHDPQLDRTVAVKVPRAGNLPGRQDLDRFLREARSTAQLRHSAIVPVHEVGLENGQPYLVSDFVDGVTLDDRLTQAGSRSAPTAVVLRPLAPRSSDRRDAWGQLALRAPGPDPRRTRAVGRSRCRLRQDCRNWDGHQALVLPRSLETAPERPRGIPIHLRTSAKAVRAIGEPRHLKVDCRYRRPSPRWRRRSPATGACGRAVGHLETKGPLERCLPGPALYRAGRYEETVKRLEKYAKGQNSADSPYYWLFMALAHQGLGHGDEAKTWFGKAESRLDREFANASGDGGGSLSWSQRLETRLLLSEARALIREGHPLYLPANVFQAEPTSSRPLLPSEK